MNRQRRAASTTLIAAIIIVVVVVAGIGYLAYVSAPQPAPVSSTFAPSASSGSSTANVSSTASSLCVQLESEPLFLIVRNSSTGSPISSVPVQVEKSTPVNLCAPTTTSTSDLGIVRTDTNGTIEVCCTGSTFFFNAAYAGRSYQLNSTAEGAESVQCVTLYIPSGLTNTTFGPQFENHC
jgi:hypothetical protein